MDVLVVSQCGKATLKLLLLYVELYIDFFVPIVGHCEVHSCLWLLMISYLMQINNPCAYFFSDEYSKGLDRAPLKVNIS